MNWEPFDVALISERLSGLKGKDSVLMHLGDMAEYSNISDLMSAPTPSAYVLLSSERMTDNAPVRQLMNSMFGVVVVVRNHAAQAASISRAKQALHPILGAIRNTLIGWSPAPTAKPITLQAGQVLDFQNGVLVWIDSYQVSHVVGIQNKGKA